MSGADVPPRHRKATTMEDSLILADGTAITAPGGVIVTADGRVYIPSPAPYPTISD